MTDRFDSRRLVAALYALGAVSMLTGCSGSDEPSPPPTLVVEGTVDDQRTTYLGGSRCFVADSGRFLATAGGHSDETELLFVGVEKNSTKVDYFQLHDRNIEIFFDASAEPRGELTATRDADLVRVVGRAPARTDQQMIQVNITVTCLRDGTETGIDWSFLPIVLWSLAGVAFVCFFCSRAGIRTPDPPKPPQQRGPARVPNGGLGYPDARPRTIHVRIHRNPFY